MSTTTTPIRLVAIGWLAVIAFAAIVAATNGLDEVPPTLVLAAIATGAGLWVWKRRSRASLIVSLVLATLLALQQLSYAAADLTSNPREPVTFVVDTLGLIAAATIVYGATGALVQYRRHNAATPAVTT